MRPLARILTETADAVAECRTCGNLDALNPCRICSNPQRDRATICVVAGVADLWAIERTGYFKGTYHVLGGILSALDGVGPSDLKIDGLMDRINRPEIQVEEVILALSATVDGQSTAHVIADHIHSLSAPPKITRLAHGVPVGGELDYLDDGTIATALQSRG
jgi:recombination protein RecR